MQLRFKDMPINAGLNASIQLGAGGMRAQPVKYIYIYIFLKFFALTSPPTRSGCNLWCRMRVWIRQQGLDSDENLAFVRTCTRACVRASERACPRACVCVRACIFSGPSSSPRHPACSGAAPTAAGSQGASCAPSAAPRRRARASPAAVAASPATRRCATPRHTTRH